MPALRPWAWMRSATAFMPLGKRCGSACCRAYSSKRGFHDQSRHHPASMLMYSYPELLSFLAMASACLMTFASVR